MTLKEVGITHALRRGVDDEKTLAMLHRGPVGVTHLGSALARALCLLTARRPVDQGSSGRLITPRGETGRPGTQPPPGPAPSSSSGNGRASRLRFPPAKSNNFL